MGAGNSADGLWGAHGDGRGLFFSGGGLYRCRHGCGFFGGGRRRVLDLAALAPVAAVAVTATALTGLSNFAALGQRLLPLNGSHYLAALEVLGRALPPRPFTALAAAFAIGARGRCPPVACCLHGRQVGRCQLLLTDFSVCGRSDPLGAITTLTAFATATPAAALTRLSGLARFAGLSWLPRLAHLGAGFAASGFTLAFTASFAASLALGARAALPTPAVTPFLRLAGLSCFASVCAGLAAGFAAALGPVATAAAAATAAALASFTTFAAAFTTTLS